MTSYRADKQVIDTHTHTDTGNDNTRRPKLASGKKLQEILNVTNYVAQKYHIEFGAAKCKVVKIGKGTKSEIRLNNQILEEVTSYKYLGELINNKGNLEDHLTATQSKIRAITAQLIAETGNKEFKGIKMKAIWQLVDATIIPILTYAAEGWNYTKKEIEKTQTIFNEALKTILFLPQGTPTTILLNETGYPAVEDIIKKKRIMQAHRLINMKKKTLIKQSKSEGFESCDRPIVRKRPIWVKIGDA